MTSHFRASEASNHEFSHYTVLCTSQSNVGGGRQQRAARPSPRAVFAFRAGSALLLGVLNERAALHVILRAVPVQRQELQVRYDRRVDRSRRDVDRGRGTLDSLRPALRLREFERLAAPVQSGLPETRRQPSDEVILSLRALRALRVLRWFRLLL